MGATSACTFFGEFETIAIEYFSLLAGELRLDVGQRMQEIKFGHMTYASVEGFAGAYVSDR